ncbi:uncharacterized protein LOC114306618 [Camellia sinensis]|uniref:uncharacterized protein LOC114306618 n=1 Tax=Camellia sinensis TaxID=4442 RepID=UPI00103647C4|nr:uncharacterized protein LOC114306618 [Camellia sinensis]
MTSLKKKFMLNNSKGTKPSMVEEFKKTMMKEYTMTDLGLMRYFLVIQVKQSKGEIFISQGKYLKDLLKKFYMSDCKSVSTPISLNDKLQVNDGAEKVDATTYRKLVGSLNYLTNTRPYIVYSINLISRFMHEPSKLNYAAAKRILRYLQGTKNLCIRYVKENDSKLIGFSDSDWAGSLDDRKSTSGYIPLPYLKIGYLTASPVGNPVVPHSDWKRTQFILNHEGLRQRVLRAPCHHHHHLNVAGPCGTTMGTTACLDEPYLAMVPQAHTTFISIRCLSTVGMKHILFVKSALRGVKVLQSPIGDITSMIAIAVDVDVLLYVSNILIGYPLGLTIDGT